MKIKIIILLIFFINITGCSQKLDTTLNDVENSIGYPSIVTEELKLENKSGYPANNIDSSSTRTPIVIPTPSNSTGVVIGRILSSIDDQPISYTTVYLGEILQLTGSDEYLFTLQEKSSPHGESDEEGNFVIYDITPGKYVILLFTPRKSVPIIDDEIGKEVVIIIEANSTLELPTYKVNWP